MTDLQHKFVTTNGIRMHYVEQAPGRWWCCAMDGPNPGTLTAIRYPRSRQRASVLSRPISAALARPTNPSRSGLQHSEPGWRYRRSRQQSGGRFSGCRGARLGPPVAWHCALLRPDIFHAIALLSVPYLPRGATNPAQVMQAIAGEENFYQLYFQEPGRAEAELEADPRRSMAMLLYSLSGDAPPDEQWKFRFPKSMKFIDTGVVPKQLPPWLSEADLDFFAGEFKRAGFRGGLNWYRNTERNWELTPFLDGAKLRQPALFVAGSEDCVGKMLPGRFQMAGAFTPNLKKQVIIPGAGHWTQEERPAEVNQLLIEFLRSL